MSTQKQGEGVSLEAQKDAIEAFASQRNLVITGWFEEKETAAKSGRPVFNQMIKQLKSGKAGGLIMHKIDRSARNLRDWAVVSDLSDRGVDVYFATESLDFRSRGGRLTADIQAVIAADFIRNLRDETIKGMTGRLKQGLYPFRAPIGYLDNGRGKPKTPCPIKAPLIKEAFTLYATGQYSIRTLATEVTTLGLRNHDGKPLSLHGIEAILKNPFYTGLIMIARTGIAYEGCHEPIVDSRIFQRVQDIKSGKAGKKTSRHNHIYQGLFRCGSCSGPMSPEKQKQFVYYRCQRSDCLTTSVREDQIDAAIARALREFELTEAQSARLRTEWLAWIDADSRTEQVRSLDLRITQIEAKLDRLLDLLVDAAVPKTSYDQKRAALMFELEVLKGDRAKIASKHLVGVEMEKFLELMKNLARLHISANRVEKRQMVQYCFSNRTVVGKQLCFEPHSWLKNRKFSDLPPLVTQNDPLIELLCKIGTSPTLPKPPEQWRKNLKHQDSGSENSKRRLP